MKVYLDTKDLIDIFQNGNPYTADDLEKILRRGGHQLVISFYTICKISMPLSLSTPTTNVMALLNRFEQLPLTYINPNITDLELQEAYNSFSSKQEYREIMPFVN